MWPLKKIKIFVVQTLYRFVWTEQSDKHEGYCLCFLTPCNGYFSTFVKTLKSPAFFCSSEHREISFNVLIGRLQTSQCSISSKPFGKWYWILLTNHISLGCESHPHVIKYITKYLFFQWLHYLHIEIASIWLSCWRYQHSKFIMLQISWGCTSMSNWYSAYGLCSLFPPGILLCQWNHW